MEQSTEQAKLDNYITVLLTQFSSRDIFLALFQATTDQKTLEILYPAVIKFAAEFDNSTE